MRHLCTSCTIVAFLPIFAAVSSAQQAQGSPAATAVPRLVRFTGSLHTAASQPTGPVGATFAIYGHQDGGAPLWSEEQNVELDKDGNYTALLGSATNQGIPAELFVSGEARWLEIQFHLPDLLNQPRILLVSVPCALKAADADTLGGMPASAFVQTGIAAAPTRNSPAVDVTPEALPATVPNSACSGLTSDGTATANQIAKFTTPCNIEPSSAIFESGGKVGIGTTTPAVTLDVKGTEFVRGVLELPAKGLATAAGGFSS